MSYKPGKCPRRHPRQRLKKIFLCISEKRDTASALHREFFDKSAGKE